MKRMTENYRDLKWDDNGVGMRLLVPTVLIQLNSTQLHQDNGSYHSLNKIMTNEKFGARPNVSPPGALSPIWRKNLGGWNSPSSEVIWPELQCISIRKTCSADFGWVNIRACNFFVSGPNVTNFFLLEPAEIVLDQFVSKFWYLDQLLRYSWSNSIVVRNQAEFSTFWPSQISGVQAPKNMYISDHAHPMTSHVAEFHRGTPFTPKATSTDISNFKHILTTFEKKL